MPPKPKPMSSKSQSQPKRSQPKTVKLGELGQSTSAPASLPMKRFDPLTAFSTLSTPQVSQTTKTQTKGKGKAKERGAVDDMLWVDRYEPVSEAELAVHVKKVDRVRNWLNESFQGGPAGSLKKYRRILALTGPSGTGKTSTLRVLSRELGFDILEWRSSSDEQFHDWEDSAPDMNYEGILTRFEAFLTRASTCNDVFSSGPSSQTKRRLILLEDLPNVLHQSTQSQFHDALRAFVDSAPSVPLVIIISDAGMRGEARDERLAEGRIGAGRGEVVDLRTVIPKDLLNGPYVTEIGFNPIAVTLMKKALSGMLNTHFSTSKSAAPPKDILDIIVESSNGDIRSAIMALQFACVGGSDSKKGLKGKGGKSTVMEAITRREQSLALFHLLGKIMYNKRKGDPPNPSATAKDLQKDRDIDALLKDPARLPLHLCHHARRTSRVDIDAIYADSPIDSSLFSLYIHQNYVQFCNDIDHCDGISDWLSWVDCSGGEAWYQTNPHQFHLLSLGTLHSLPSPVPRRSQKYYKPEFFSYLQKEKDAWESVQTVKEWIAGRAVATDDSGWRAGGWSRNEVILELGGVLRAQEQSLTPSSSASTRSSNSAHAQSLPPTQHRLFSKLDWMRITPGAGGQHGQLLDEEDTAAPEEAGLGNEVDGGMLAVEAKERSQAEKGGWLDGDDIEDFD